MEKVIKVLPVPVKKKSWQVQGDNSSRSNSIPESVQVFTPRWDKSRSRYSLEGIDDKELNELVSTLSLYDLANNSINKANPYNIKDKFFTHKDLYVKLKENAQFFNESNPLDKIKLAILKSYKEFIATSKSDVNPRSEQRWYIVNEEKDREVVSNKVARELEAIKRFNKLTNQKRRIILKTLLGITSTRTNSYQSITDADNEWVKTVLYESFVKDNKTVYKGKTYRDIFLDLTDRTDEELHLYELISKAIFAGVLRKRGAAIYDRDDTKLASSVDALVVKYKNPDYQSEKDLIETELSLVQR